MRSVVYIMAGCIFLSGCTVPGMQVRPYFLKVPEGDDSYSVGFRDGCDSVLGVGASGPVSTSNQFSYDVNRGIEDPQYYKGYRLGSNYCLYYLDSGPL